MSWANLEKWDYWNTHTQNSSLIFSFHLPLPVFYNRCEKCKLTFSTQTETRIERINRTRKRIHAKRKTKSERGKEIVQRNRIFSWTYNENTTEHNYGLIEIETLTTSDAQLNVRGCHTHARTHTNIHEHKYTYASHTQHICSPTCSHSFGLSVTLSAFVLRTFDRTPFSLFLFQSVHIWIWAYTHRNTHCSHSHSCSRARSIYNYRKKDSMATSFSFA